MSPPLPLGPHLQDVLQHLLAHAWCALLCDEDSILPPGGGDPSAARLAPAVAQAFQTLVQHPHYQVALLSARSLAELHTRVANLAQAGMFLVGNLGLDMLGPGIAHTHPEATLAQPLLTRLAPALQRLLTRLPGAWVETTGMTLTIHLRDIPPDVLPTVQYRVMRLLRHALETRTLVLRAGESFVEIRPRVAWEQAEAVRWLLHHMQWRRPGAPGVVLYLGDNTTEDGACDGWEGMERAILIGTSRRDPQAHYYLESAEQLVHVLTRLGALAWHPLATPA